MPTIRTPPATGQITTTVGSGSYNLAGALEQDGVTLYTFSEAVSFGWLADGEQVYYNCKDDGGALEWGIGTYNHGAQTIARSVLGSTNGGAAISWGAGNKSLFVGYVPDKLVLGDNFGTEYSSNYPLLRSNIGLGTAALLNAGTSVNNLVQLLAGSPAKLPVVDGSNLVGLPASPIPSGTVMVFYQAAAPSGWTRVTTVNDKVPIIVSAGSPGTVNGTGWPIDDLSSSPVTLTIAQIPSHSHLVGADTLAASGGAANSPVSFGAGTNKTSSETGGGESHNHIISSAGTWRPPGAFMLLASRN